jgi:glycosyltransferase involved in cell wall biosynthesis
MPAVIGPIVGPRPGAVATAGWHDDGVPGRVLIVAYYFPPIGGIGSIRLARFASLLPDCGWETAVLAPRATPHAADADLQFPEQRVVRSRSIELSQLGRMVLGARVAPAQTANRAASAGTRAGLRAAAHRYLFFPDPQVGWYPGAIAAGLRTLRRQRFDAIYSSAYPMTCHLIARTLSRRSGLPWVAEYRDPWSDRLAPDHPYLRLARRLERAVAHEATTVVLPTATWAEHYGGLWGTTAALLPNGHDSELPQWRPPTRPTLTYVGSFYPADHDLTTLWQALARWRSSDGVATPRVRFVGHLPAQVREQMSAHGIADLLESAGFVPHDEAMRELMSSSMLVASGIAGDHPARRGWVPAKLFEYLASGLPVLYLGDPSTNAAQLLSGHAGCHVVPPGDVEGALTALRSGLADGRHDRAVDHLSRAAGARTLARILDDACHAGPPER